MLKWKKTHLKKAISKLKPKKQSCCSVEIEENKESTDDHKNKDQQNNKEWLSLINEKEQYNYYVFYISQNSINKL